MNKEIISGFKIGDQDARFVLGNIQEAFCGAWVEKPTDLPAVLKPHVKKMDSGREMVPARLIRRVQEALSQAPTLKQG